MFEVKLTIGLNPETIGLLGKLLGSTTALPAAVASIVQAEAPAPATNGVKVSKTRITEPASDKKLNGHTEKASASNTETSTLVITFEEVRAKIAAKKQELNDAAPIKKLLSSYGVDKATELSADSYVEFVTKLETLKPE